MSSTKTAFSRSLYCYPRGLPVICHFYSECILVVVIVVVIVVVVIVVVVVVVIVVVDGVDGRNGRDHNLCGYPDEGEKVKYSSLNQSRLKGQSHETNS